jgi:hypothetical protein
VANVPTKVPKVQQKREFVMNLAYNRVAKKLPPMRIEQLAWQLNQAGIKTSGGDPFIEDRGAYRLLEAVVRWLRTQNRHAEAENIWNAFERPKK